MTKTEYTIHLAAALKAEVLSHALYNLLTATAAAQESRGYATTAQIAISLGVSFNSIHLHLHKSPQLFGFDKETLKNQGRPPMMAITLSQEGMRLLAAINKRVQLYATQPAV